jgi:precorrin-8X/cobalt-precorrin-8 methylmutase
MGRDYIKDPAEIYRRSFATIEAEAGLERLPQELQPVVRRMIHACGMTDLVQDIAWGGNPVEAGRDALAAGAPIICDVKMLASGISSNAFEFNERMCMLSNLPGKQFGKELHTTRSAAAVELWRPHILGAVVAIGNAPTALFHLIELLEVGFPRPAVIFGFPVGFVGAVESKDALIEAKLGIPYITLRGRRGGSAIAAAAVNALAEAVA